MFLGRPRNEWKNIHTLAVNIEKGIPDLQNALEQGKLDLFSSNIWLHIKRYQ